MSPYKNLSDVVQSVNRAERKFLVKTKIVIHVDNGVARTVWCSTSNVTVDIVATDRDDEDDRREKDDIRLQRAADELFEVY